VKRAVAAAGPPEALRQLLAELAIESPFAFRLAGRRFPVDPAPAAAGGLPPEQAPIALAIAGTLYRFAYSRPLVSPLPAEDPPSHSPFDRELLARLAPPNGAGGRWEEGWVISAVHSGGQVTARRGSLERDFWPGQYISLDGPLARPRAGAVLRVFYARDSTTLQPGFYYRFSEAAEEESYSGVIRAYWNIHREGAATLMSRLPPRLDAFHLPYRMKCMALASEFARTDAAVLYFSKRHAPLFFELLLGLHGELEEALEDAVPLFTLRLAKGLGLAEDPTTGESFGQHRCRLVAEAAWASFLAGKTDLEAVLKETRRRLAAAGVDPERLYRNAGPHDAFAAVAPPPRGKRAARQAARAAPAPSDFLDAAVSIGARLCRDALWAGERCNWFGFSMEMLDGRWRQAQRTYGPELYGGTGGIGLFLGRLHAATGEPIFRRTALGAIRHALARTEDLEPGSRWGLYAGWPGIAWAALEAGEQMADPALRREALRLLKELRPPGGEQVDVLAGIAGAIPVLVGAARRFGGPQSLLAKAETLGDALIAAGTADEIGLSWGDAGQPGSRLFANLTGYSHGAAGIGWSLFELWRACGEPRFRAAGEETLRYERNYFDAGEGNWPDLRLPEQSGAPVASPPGPSVRSFMKAWCHGAPGIGLARLRAYEILGDDACREEAEIAIASTLGHFVPGHEMSQSNYSLCHGIFGNADLLLEGERVLARPELRRKAEELGRQGLATVLAQHQPWPCGTLGQVEVPGLLLGLAGIGHHYLRLADPATPSLLLIRPD
jgi:lantibiotic biosynthesis protein